MAAGVALSKAKIDGPGIDQADVAILVRNNVLRVNARRGGLILEDPTVQTSERLDTRTWRITTDAGVFTITKAKGCGCGR